MKTANPTPPAAESALPRKSDKWPLKLVSGGAQFMESLYVLRAVYVRGRYRSGSVNGFSADRRSREWTIEMPLGTVVGSAHNFKLAKLKARQLEAARP